VNVIKTLLPYKAQSVYGHMANLWAAAENGDAIAAMKHMAKMYKSLEDKVEEDPPAWRLVRAHLDDVQELCANLIAEKMSDLSEDMWAVGLLGGE